MKLLAILLITWIDGSQTGFKVPADMTCGDLMDKALVLAKAHDMEHTMMRCIYTDQIIVSPRPMPRPIDLGA
jgi:hypothetical protein